MTLERRAKLLHRSLSDFFWGGGGGGFSGAHLRGFPVEFRKNGGKRNLRDDLLFIGILEERCGWEIKREEEEG